MQITELLRRVRWKVDQEATRHNIEPFFKELYANKYEKNEFLLGADMQFYKVKKLLDNNPSVLKDDPVISIDYMKIINLLKQKKLLETTSDPYDPENSYQTIWNDPSQIMRDKLLEEKRILERYRKVRYYLILESLINVG